LLILYGANVAVSFLALVLIEAAVVLTEAGLLIFALPTENKFKLTVFSLLANTASFVAGLMLLGLLN
jgi:hypothetical protein